MKTDHILINRCKKGDSAAQKQLYELHRHRWFTICLRYVHKREDALDVLQNALIKIYSKLNQFNSELGQFSSWSSKIVVNESIMFQRKYWNKNEISGLNLELINDHEDEKAISNLTLEEMTRRIQKLPTGYRLVFNMYVIEGYSHKEIAATLGISIGTSKSQLFKAKGILKKQIESNLKETNNLIALVP